MAHVGAFVLENHVKTLPALKWQGMERYIEGERDLFDFVANNSDNGIASMTKRVWGMHDEVANKGVVPASRMEKLAQVEAKERVEDCNGQWLQCARQVLSWNGINLYSCTAAVRELLEKGRRKGRNIFVHGESNCGKSFLFEPLALIYECFTTPAAGKFAWTGLDSSEVVFLNDFRWHRDSISWQELLNLLAGAPCKLSRLKNLYATDLYIPRTNTLPFFATGPKPIEYVGSYGVTDKRESDMMDSRWRVFEFTYKVPRNQILLLDPCGRCFVEFAMLGSD